MSINYTETGFNVLDEFGRYTWGIDTSNTIHCKEICCDDNKIWAKWTPLFGLKI